MKNILIISLLFVGCSFDNNYEYDVINDIFPTLMGEPHNWVNNTLPPIPITEIENQFENYDKIDWERIDSLYSPFPYSKQLGKIKNIPNRISEFYKLYDNFTDSLCEFKVNNHELILYSTDTLYALSKADYGNVLNLKDSEYMVCDSKKNYLKYQN